MSIRTARRRAVARVRLPEPQFAWVVRLVGVAGLVVALFAIPLTNAGFTATTGNTGNVVAADTLEPPTSLGGVSGLSIALDWTATVDSYASGYRLFRSSTSGGPYTQIADVTPQSIESHVDAPPEGRYYYVARSYSGAWESVDSNEATARVWRPFDCPADPDLRACIRFDTDLGGTYADGSGYGNTVTHSNSSQVEGISDQAAYGTPAARYEMADSVSLDIDGELTMEMWVRFDSVPSTGRAGLIDNDGQYSLIYWSGTGLECSNGPHKLPHVPVPVAVWFHVACSWDGSVLTLYFDGLPVVSMLSTGTIGTSNTDPVSLLNTSPAFDEPLDGAMDNVRIWQSGRTQAEICADAGLTC